MDELWGQRRYRVWLPSLNAVLLHRQEEIGGQSSRRAWSTRNGVKFAAVAGRVLDLLNDNKLLAPLDSAVVPLPHQIRCLRRVVAHPGKVRYLLATRLAWEDHRSRAGDPGIEAARAREARAVVAPKGLIPQWIRRDEGAIGEDFRHFDPGQFDAYRRIAQEENVWRSHDRVICSMDAVKPLDTRKGWDRQRIEAFNRDRIIGLASAGWDMIVIDESHRVAGSSDTVARHAMARMLAEAAPYLLLLSATPHQGKTDAFQRLMSRWMPRRFRTRHPSPVTGGALRRPHREAAGAQPDGSALFKPASPVGGGLMGGARGQRELYDAVTEYVRQGYNQAMRKEDSHRLPDGPDAAFGQQFHPGHRRPPWSVASPFSASRQGNWSCSPTWKHGTKWTGRSNSTPSCASASRRSTMRRRVRVLLDVLAGGRGRPDAKASALLD